MARRIRVTRSKRFHAVAMLLGLVAAAVVAPAANAGKTTDPLYTFTLAGAPSDDSANGITSDGLGSYVEPTDASGPYWAMGVLGGRSFTLTMDGLVDVAGVPATDYACVAGSSMYTDTNPFIFCYGDKEQTRGFILDYPPYGNATKQTMKLACGIVRTEGSTYITDMPATGCKAEVWQVNGGRNAPKWHVDVPFHFESQLQ